MKRIKLFLSLLPLLTACSNQVEWVDLLDSKLSDWDSYLSYSLQEGYNGDIPKDMNGLEVLPIGLNNDADKVFSIIEESSYPVLRINGEIYGCLVSKKEYSNYHLKLDVKWGDQKSGLRKSRLKDSGILYHSYGSYGADYFRSWMMAQEFQIMEGHMGDYWNQVNTAIDIRAYPSESMMNAVSDVNQHFISLGKGEELPGFCLRNTNFEVEEGEWNTLELICFEDKSVHLVNGQVVMILKNSRYVEDGITIPLEKGKIQLQSEGAEVFFKSIRIKNLESLPKQIAKYY